MSQHFQKPTSVAHTPEIGPAYPFSVGPTPVKASDGGVPEESESGPDHIDGCSGHADVQGDVCCGTHEGTHGEHGGTHSARHSDEHNDTHDREHGGTRNGTHSGEHGTQHGAELGGTRSCTHGSEHGSAHDTTLSSASQDKGGAHQHGHEEHAADHKRPVRVNTLHNIASTLRHHNTLLWVILGAAVVCLVLGITQHLHNA